MFGGTACIRLLQLSIFEFVVRTHHDAVATRAFRVRVHYVRIRAFSCQLLMCASMCDQIGVIALRCRCWENRTKCK